MKGITLALAAAASLAAMPIASAQTRAPLDECTRQIDEVARQIPDLSENPDAAAELGLDREQLQAALAALDAARIVNYDKAKCATMVDAAEAMLDKGT